MKAKVKTLINLSGSKNAFTTLLNPTQYEKYPDYENLSESDKQKFNDFYKDLSWELLLNYIVPIYAKYYTEDDLDELIKFYNSSVGKKFINSSMGLMSELSLIPNNFIDSMNNILKDNLWKNYYDNWSIGGNISL
jgi:hypothetical protein